MAEAERVIRKRWEVLVAICSMLAAIVAAVSAFQSYRVANEALKSSEQMVAINAYIELRKTFFALSQRIPHEYFEGKHSVPKEGSKVRREIANYWYESFDEWWVTKKMGGPTLARLWDLRYPLVECDLQVKKDRFRATLAWLLAWYVRT